MNLRLAAIALLLVLSTLAVYAGFFVHPSTYHYLRIEHLMSDCDYSAPSCANNEYCVQIGDRAGRCLPKSASMPLILFPKTQDTPIVCTQGSLTGKDRTHSFLNTAYALDLGTSPQHKSPQIKAVFSGRVVVNDGCDNHDEKEKNVDDCGAGFGNWVALYNQDSSHVAFYAHLRKVTVKNGDIVSAGQILGEEGKTGKAGIKHLHFSIHDNYFGIRPSDMEKIGPWLPPSIPFRVKIKDANGDSIVKTSLELPCENNDDLTRAPFFGGD